VYANVAAIRAGSAMLRMVEEESEEEEESKKERKVWKPKTEKRDLI
jgi:hypothetical protein